MQNLRLKYFPPGMRTFTTVWFGQLVSMVGTGMTQFALAVYVFQKTGSATAYGFVLFFGMLPGIIVSLISGVLADRYDRRKIMIGADCLAAFSTLCVALLYMRGNLEVWHICAAVATASTATAFQGPAWGSMTALLVPHEHLMRASGLNSLARSAQQIAGPLLGGVLVLIIGIEGIILIDFATFFVALGCTLAVRFPPIPESEGAKKAKGSVLREARYGWAYVWGFPALRAHLAWFASLNFVLSFLWVLFPPMVLSFTNAAGLGTVASCYGWGMLAGGMTLTAWGGPKRRVLGMLGGGVLAGVGMLGMGLRPSVPLIAASLFLLTFGLPTLNGSFSRIWGVRIPPDVQGRAVAVISVTSWSTQPIAYLAAGPLGDRFFRPLLVEGGPLANTFVGQVLGTGPGRGIGLLLVIGGVMLLALTAIAALSPTFAAVEESIAPIVKSPTAAPEPEPAAAAEGQPDGQAPTPVPSPA
jgi:DHA3 family macrolide efflux protein-like MFS transporter